MKTDYDYKGKITFISGPEKHCGKTTFMNRAVAMCRNLASPAIMTVGYDGEARDFLSGARKPAVPVFKDDVFITTERFAMPACPEIIDVLPGSTAMGKLCIAKANRHATIALVGPESNSILAWAIDYIIQNKISNTIFVDGAINRITQAASLDINYNTSLLYVLRVDKANVESSISKMRHILKIMHLPIASTITSPSAIVFNDALTASNAERLYAESYKHINTVIIPDFTKIFLTDSELSIFMRRYNLQLVRRIDFTGFQVICRGLSNKEFTEILNDKNVEQYLTYNAYEEIPQL